MGNFELNWLCGASPEERNNALHSESFSEGTVDHVVAIVPMERRICVSKNRSDIFIIEYQDWGDMRLHVVKSESGGLCMRGCSMVQGTCIESSSHRLIERDDG